MLLAGKMRQGTPGRGWGVREVQQGAGGRGLGQREREGEREEKKKKMTKDTKEP